MFHHSDPITGLFWKMNIRSGPRNREKQVTCLRVRHWQVHSTLPATMSFLSHRGWYNWSLSYLILLVNILACVSVRQKLLYLKTHNYLTITTLENHGVHSISKMSSLITFPWLCDNIFSVGLFRMIKLHYYDLIKQCEVSQQFVGFTSFFFYFAVLFWVYFIYFLV